MYVCTHQKKTAMNKRGKIDIFALTDCHQEARKLGCLLSGIMCRAPQNGKNTLICDGGDLFKGIYDRKLCISEYLLLRQQLPEAKIVLALGNNDFGFDSKDIEFLRQTADSFNQADIHFLCANLKDTATGECPEWVNPYILLEICGKKIMVTAFCINYIRLQKYNLRLDNIAETFVSMIDTIKRINPDALVILNHALRNSSENLWNLAVQNNLRVDLIIGGHEHSPVEPIPEQKTYYPAAFSRNMLHFEMSFIKPEPDIELLETISSRSEPLNRLFEPMLDSYEESSGLNIPVAPSILDLPRSYSDFCSIGSFTADQMRSAAKADLALLSTGYLTHSLRYEKDKILTVYNLERVFSAPTPVQTVLLSPKIIKEIFNNAVHNRYIQRYGNTRFLQCSQNVCLVCGKNSDGFGEVKQITINNVPLLDDDGNPLHPEDEYLCALDPFIGAGEIGYDMLRPLAKETLMKNNRLIRIKDLIYAAVKEAEHKYPAGTVYPAAHLIDL